MNRLEDSKLPSQVLDFFEQYAHGGISRRQFLVQASKFTIGGIAGASILANLASNHALAQQVQPDKPDEDSTVKDQPMTEAEVREHRGRPTIFVNGKPLALAAYSPVSGRRPELFREQSTRFFPHGLDLFLVTPPPGILPEDDEHDEWCPPLFWRGDEITGEPLLPPAHDLDADVAHILTGAPDAWIVLRTSPDEPASWRALHPDELFVNDKGERLETPSLASDLFTEMRGRVSKAWIGWCERRPWASRIVGYWNGDRVEGSHQPLIDGWLFDHSPVMLAKWRVFLQQKYKTVDALRTAHNNPAADFVSYDTPRDENSDMVADLAKRPFWPCPPAVRDYLELTRDLYHARLRRLVADTRAACGDRKRVLIYDCLKQWMQGWSNLGFFDPEKSWPLAFPDILAGSGHISVAPLLDTSGLDGLVTPHDYQARGIGGVYENEGASDSCVLRGRLFLSEMDTRTWTGTDVCFPARDLNEFKAITWRNLATAWTRGFHAYWMDVYEDWFAAPEMHTEVIAPQVRAIRQALEWEHADEPGIAVIIDDSAALDADARGNYLNEAVMWEVRNGLARCGVPHRIYLLDDLALEKFPAHRVYWFPVVMRDGRIAVWGPASGISDGAKASAVAAEELTGFRMELIPSNLPRRVLVSDFSHPATQGVDAGAFYGGALAYGPTIVPLDGQRLGEALLHRGLARAGLAAKEFGRGAGQGRGPGDWASVFTIAHGLPADFWRGLARWAGAHVWCESNDVLMADRSVVALHTLKGGPRTLHLPRRSKVWDVLTDQVLANDTDTIDWLAPDGPDTRVFHLQQR
ncbi:MAG: hypothetical protein ACYTGH_04835 [Planctomycetota bacterium]|jgi:hypothetical protein